MGQLGKPSRVAGRYRLTEVIGRGGMGTVWRAEDELLGRAVAVKVIAAPDALMDAGPLDGPPPETLAQTAGRARREARAAGRLNHPGAVTVHDIIEEDGRFHIIMELIQALTVTGLVRAEGPLPPARVAAIGAQVLDVLDFAHAEGIVHRDIKPSNVMVLAHDRVKLTDFGIAQLRGDPQLTASGTTIGSPLFMAPEQAAGTMVGPAADLWSLGATMYYAVEGRAPFERSGTMAVLAAILSQPPDPPRLAGPLEPALIALLVKDPESRPDGVVLRRLLSLAGVGDSSQAASSQAASSEAANPASTNPETPNYGTPEQARPAPAVTEDDRTAVQDPLIDRPEPPAERATVHDRGESSGRRSGPGSAVRPSPRVGRRDGKARPILIGVCTAIIATVSYSLLQPVFDSDQPRGSEVTTVQQDPGAAPAENPAGETEAVVVPAALAPLAANAPSDGLGLGSAGQAGLRQIKTSDAGPRGQRLPRFFESASNPVGGYAAGVPLGFDSVAAGPITFIERNDGMFRAVFEVRSYRAMGLWDRLLQDEKKFAKDHAADNYQRLRMTRQWTYAGRPAAAWEFTWTLNDTLMHARVVAFRVGPRTYTVLYRSADVWWLGGGSSEWPTGFEQSFYPSP